MSRETVLDDRTVTGQPPIEMDSSVREEVEAAWAYTLGRLKLGSAVLLHASGMVPTRRTYRKEARIYKVHLRLPHAEPKFCDDLAWEYEVLRLCEDLPELPRPRRYLRTGQFEAAIYDYIPSVSLADCRAGYWRRLGVLGRTAAALVRLSWRGIAHNDLMRENVLIAKDGRVFLIDMGKSQRLTRPRAFYHNFLRLRETRSMSAAFVASFVRLTFKTLKPPVPEPVDRWIGVVLLYIRRGRGGPGPASPSPGSNI